MILAGMTAACEGMLGMAVGAWAQKLIVILELFAYS